MNGPCKENLDVIANQVLGLLDSLEDEVLAAHAKTCSACATYGQALKQDHERLLRFGVDLEAALPARIDRCITSVTRPAPMPEQQVISVRRRINTGLFIKIAVAAVVVMALVLMPLTRPDKAGAPSTLQLLNAVAAAENALFMGDQTVYIRNEITVYPSAVAREWGGAWLPMCSLKADGAFRFDQLKLAVEDQPYTVIDQAWYDSPTGRFVRLLEADDQVVFGNAYDGSQVFTAQWDENQILQVDAQSMGNRFTAPTQPAEFFGLAAGLPSGLSAETQNLLTIEAGSLVDGSPVHIYQVGAPGPSDPNRTYWLFRVRDDDHTVAEKEFIVENETVLLIRRVRSESTDATGIHFDMRELQGRQTSLEQAPKASVSANLIQADVSVQHMVDTAGFETYSFNALPAGVEKWDIMDINMAGPEERMFLVAGRAEDRRHVLLIQSPMLSQRIGQGDMEGLTRVHTSPSGVKVWAGSPPALAKMLLQSAVALIRDEPADDCVVYGLEFPGGWFAPLAVNGTLTEKELQDLADSLIPSREYLRSSMK